MDRYGYDHWDGGHPWFWMLLMMLVLVVVLVGAAYVLMRASQRTPTASPPPPTDEPARILDERFARGEIDAEDYEARRELLKKR